MWIFLLLVILLTIILLSVFKPKPKVDYKCFLLTLPTSHKRRQKFLKNYDDRIPLEIVMGKDTKNIEEAKKFEYITDPKYFKEALRLYYNKDRQRPDMSYFNLGAIGCYMGHMDIYRRCFEQGLKYALIFEDNVIIKDSRLFTEVQEVIDTMGDEFELCFFHCLSRYPDTTANKEPYEKVKWISSTKCYLINVENMKKYYNFFFPIDTHVDLKHEDLIYEGARVYYKDLRDCIKITRGGGSTIGHSDWGQKKYFSRKYPSVTTRSLKYGY